MFTKPGLKSFRAIVKLPSIKPVCVVLYLQLMFKEWLELYFFPIAIIKYILLFNPVPVVVYLEINQ